MNRKDYQIPTMTVVKLQHRSNILSGSNGSAGVQNYTWHNESEESRATPKSAWNVDEDEE